MTVYGVLAQIPNPEELEHLAKRLAFFERIRLLEGCNRSLLYVTLLDGFVGFRPKPPLKTICAFETLEAAELAKVLIKLKGVEVDEEIQEVEINDVRKL